MDVRPEEWVEAAGRLVTAEPVVMVRMPPRAWDRSMTDACAGVRSTCDRDTLDIVQLSPFDLERIKGGEPFQALRSLRDRGWVRFFGIGVDSRDDALWVLEHTPAHVLTVDARLEPGAWEEVLGLAGETDSGVIATAAALGHDLDHAKTLLANTSLTAVSWPLPAR